MWKYTVEVRGMMCAMCESHVNDAVRRALRVKSVRSSRAKNETVVLAEQALDEAALRDAIAATGYEVGGVTRQQAQKGCSAGGERGRCRRFDILPPDTV